MGELSTKGWQQVERKMRICATSLEQRGAGEECFIVGNMLADHCSPPYAAER
jgi:hypothetical protein